MSDEHLKAKTVADLSEEKNSHLKQVIQILATSLKKVLTVAYTFVSVEFFISY